jgi:hypothetical protein
MKCAHFTCHQCEDEQVAKLRAENEQLLQTVKDLSFNADPSAFKTMLQVDKLRARVAELEELAGEYKARAVEAQKQAEEHKALHPIDEWHEDFGPVLWWRVPIQEPPYCGSPLEDDFPEDYYTHWSKLPEVKP